MLRIFWIFEANSAKIKRMKYLDYSQAEMIEIGITDLFCDFQLMYGVEKNYVEL